MSMMAIPLAGVTDVNVDLRSYNQTQPYYSFMRRLKSPTLRRFRVIGTSTDSVTDRSGGSVIDFVMDPTTLDTADIDLTNLSFLSMREGTMPLFANLSNGRMTLTRSSGVNDFLLFLQIAPNLKVVFVTLSYEEGNPLADMTQLAVIVPGLLLKNLDYVNIIGLQGNNDEVNLVGYILKNAIGLNHLYILVDVDNAVEDEDARVGKQFKFCKDCFSLPITSLTTRVVFSDQYVRATNDTTTSHNEIILHL
ncbi:F-box/LRR-repeat protein 13 [Bienertia sinuspersici]